MISTVWTVSRKSHVTVPPTATRVSRGENAKFSTTTVRLIGAGAAVVAGAVVTGAVVIGAVVIGAVVVAAAVPGTTGDNVGDKGGVTGVEGADDCAEGRIPTGFVGAVIVDGPVVDDSSGSVPVEPTSVVLVPSTSVFTIDEKAPEIGSDVHDDSSDPHPLNAKTSIEQANIGNDLLFVLFTELIANFFIDGAETPCRAFESSQVVHEM
ncbi:MAG: hypothetical protein RL726_1901 [Actinomycetota bacterium]